MKVVKTKEGNGHITLDVTVPTGEVAEVLNQAAMLFCNQNNVKPVPGKTPAQAVRESMGIRDLDGVVAEQAMEMLSLQEMSLFSRVNARLQKEDLYSVIESFFMPSGMETDQYALMGEITACTPWENRMTGAKGWFLEVTAADIPVRVSIAADDLMGDPQPGRRFKGNIWLQGTVEC